MANPFQNLNIMDKKDIFIICIKTLIYALTAILAVLGVSAMTSCSASRSVDVNGRAVIVTTDTTFVNHSSVIKFPKMK